MDKTLKQINWIKAWLQMFGERDNETFSIEIEAEGVHYDISMQYNFDLDGDQIQPYDWCSSGKGDRSGIKDRTGEELDAIIKKLKEIKIVN